MTFGMSKNFVMISDTYSFVLICWMPTSFAKVLSIVDEMVVNFNVLVECMRYRISCKVNARHVVDILKPHIFACR